MKRRKRTNKEVPAKGRLRDMADRVWSLAVKHDWAWLCAVCGSQSSLNSHHIIPREHKTWTYKLRNGICLCSYCHVRHVDHSPHVNAAGWMLWLKDAHPALERWYTETTATQEYKRFHGTINAEYYCDVLRRLRQYVEPEEFEQIVGVRFARWLEENE